MTAKCQRGAKIANSRAARYDVCHENREGRLTNRWIVNQMKRTSRLGVLGGMGPLATAHFLRRLVELTPAVRDQDHVPVVVWGDSTIPDRVGPIFGRGEPPLPAMIDGLNVLADAGATMVAIVCNTAHHWYREMTEASALPIFHIADAALSEVPAGIDSVGLIATRGTLASGFYQARLAAVGHRAVVPDDGEQDTLVLPGIAAVKAGRTAEAAALFHRAGSALAARGAAALILACTEVSVAWPDDAVVPVVDATDALARACIAAYRQAMTAG
jgi:aspartate racemase